jgi:hypothetical protein
VDTPKKKYAIRNLYNRIQANRLKNLKLRLNWKKKIIDLKTELQKDSQKAVLICFIFYVIVQVYSMIVMVKYCDFTHLGELIDKTGEIVQNCVFGYLVKAGVENVGKIFTSRASNETHDEASG